MDESTEPTSERARHGALYLRHPEAHIPGHELSEVPSPAPKPFALLVLTILGAVVAIAGFQLHHWAAGAEVPRVALPWVIPFFILLGSIAVMPFIHRHWWEHNYARVAAVLGFIITIYYLFGFENAQLGRKAIAASVAEYISFIFLLGSLYVVSGGILIRVRAKATPLANVALLLIGAIIANFFGTTGASMLLIRPFLRMNKGHLRPYHVVFFIFIVSNLGGSLTPIGDPPLFLGFLQGVPFWWVFEHCNLIWLLSNGMLLVMFFIIDQLNARRTVREQLVGDDLGPKMTMYGAVNLLFVGLIVGGILLHGPINHTLHNTIGFELPVRELCMLLAMVGSLLLTPRRVHIENKFAYGPIKEVAFLFIGIFLTMTPALNYLYTRGSNGGIVHTPTQFYFATGTLSGFLDNAPTYLTFLQSELGQLDAETVARVNAIAKRPGSDITESDLAGLSEEHQRQLKNAVAGLLKYHGERVNAGTITDGEVRIAFLINDPKLNLVLIAISMGAVMFGAATYIGNGPNFMVKAIADHSGVAMPSFFGYIFRYTLPFLLPVLLLVWVIFIR